MRLDSQRASRLEAALADPDQIDFATAKATAAGHPVLSHLLQALQAARTFYEQFATPENLARVTDLIALILKFAK